MLLALTSFFFILGFCSAAFASTKSKKSDLNHIFANLRHVINALRGGSIPTKLDNTIKIVENDDEIDEGVNTLMTRAQVEADFDVGSWQSIAYEEFKDTILARDGTRATFPCVYATKGFRANDHRYIFLESDDPSAPHNVRVLGPGIRAYLHEAHALGPNTSLVIICAPGDEIASVAEYTTRFWNFLRGLRIFDEKAWPTDVPADTKDAKWTFCFNGEPLFPIALTPAHERRKSRFMSNFIIAMQPKWVIDNLMCTPEKRKNATETVRGLLAKYDDIEISPDLSQYGAPGTTEARQLALLDENVTSECPYKDFDR